MQPCSWHCGAGIPEHGTSQCTHRFVFLESNSAALWNFFYEAQINSDHEVKPKISGRLFSDVTEGNSLDFQRQIFSLGVWIYIYVCVCVVKYV